MSRERAWGTPETLATLSESVARLREVNVALAEAKQAEENLRKANEARLVELERVRKRIATDLHDDIGSSLTRISLLSEVTQRQGRQVETAAGGSALTTVRGAKTSRTTSRIPSLKCRSGPRHPIKQ